MKSALRIYSDILQLRTKAFLTLKHADGGMRYAVSMFTIVGLLAGAGLWIGLPALLQRPLLVERIDQVSALVDRLDKEVVPGVNASLDAISRENLSIALEDLLPKEGAVSAGVLSDILARAGMTASQFADTLSAEAAGLSEAARTQLAEQVETIRQSTDPQGRVTSQQIDQLLTRTTLTPDQIAGMLTQASTVQSALGRLTTQAAQQAPPLEQLLAQIPWSAQQFQGLLARLALTPERLKNLTLQFGLTPEQINGLKADINAAPEQINAVLAEVRAGVEQFNPPLGPRFSRVIRMFGAWISTPLNLLAGWAYFGLVLLVAAKLLGGTGTVRQHLIGLLLATAPLFLLFFTYVPEVTPAMPPSFNLAFDYYGRVLTLVAVAWALLILVKSMSVTHEFGLWRSVWAVTLTWVVMYVVLPIVSFAAVGYILRG